MPDQATLDYIGPIWEHLDGGIWHTTSEERFQSILRSGGIDPEPSGIPDSERWGTARGPDYYPIVRYLGGVSLFDFSDFQMDTYSEAYRLSSWSEFLPFRRQWGASVWIGINAAHPELNLMSAEAIRAIWREPGNLRRKWMPKIEMANIGRVPIGAFAEAWVVGEGRLERLQVAQGITHPTDF